MSLRAQVTRLRHPVGWWALGLLLLVALLGRAGSAVAQNPPTTAAAYWQLLRELHAALGSPAGDVEAAAQQLAAVTTVVWPDGRETPVDHRELLADLAAADGDRERAAARVAALLAWETAAALPPADDAAALAALQRILDRPEFRTAEPNALQRFWRDLRLWLAERFFDLLRLLDAAPGPLSWQVVIIGSLALGALLLYWARALRRQFAPDDALTLTAVDRPLSGRSAWEQGQAAAQAGDRRAAVRLLYLAALLALDERGVLRYDRARTNREVLRAVRPTAELHQLLQPIVADFDRVWYGFEALSGDEFEQFNRRVAQLLARQTV